MTNFYKNIFKYVTFKTDVKLIQPIFYLISTNKTSNSRMFCLLSLYIIKAPNESNRIEF